MSEGLLPRMALNILYRNINNASSFPGQKTPVDLSCGSNVAGELPALFPLTNGLFSIVRVLQDTCLVKYRSPVSINPPSIHRRMLRPVLSRTTLSALARPIQANCLVRPALRVSRRGYADAPSSELKLSLSVPHQSVFANKEVCVLSLRTSDDDRKQVNIPSTAGDMGVLSNHVPSVVQLKPGVVEVIIEGQPAEKWFGLCRLRSRAYFSQRWVRYRAAREHVIDKRCRSICA